MNRLKKLSSILLIIAVLVLMSACGGAASDTADKTGIIGAMDEEVASLKSAMKISATTTIAGMEFCEGTLDGKSVVVVQCGIGKVNAGICAHTLINTFGVKRVINTGVAGSLDSAIDVGDIVVSTDAVQHDFDVSPVGADCRLCRDIHISTRERDAPRGGHQAITIGEDRKPWLAGPKCVGCHLCVLVCPSKAITSSRKRVSKKK